MQQICDQSSSDISEEESVKSTQKVDSETNSTESSSESSLAAFSSRSILHKQRQSRAVQKAKTLDRRNFRSSSIQKISKLSTREKNVLNENNRSDSDNDSMHVLSNKSVNQHTMKRNIKTDKKLNSKRNCHNYIDSSDESEAENVEYKDRSKKQPKKVISLTNEESKRIKEKSTRRTSVIPEENSDVSSGDEFQKVKFQKFDGNKFFVRQLANLEMDYTHTPTKENKESESENVNDVKETLKECKKICSNFLINIESLEHRYKKNTDQLLIKSAEKINNLSTLLQTKCKNLSTIYESRSKSKNRKKVAKKVHKVVSDNEATSEEESLMCKERLSSESQHLDPRKEQGKKNVSECDSDEIFSADETRSSKKKRKDDPNSGVKSDDTVETLTDKMKNSETNYSRDTTASPVIGISKEKRTNEERSNKKQLFSKSINISKAQSTDSNSDDNSENDKQTDANDICDNEMENSPLRDGSKKKKLDDTADTEHLINESIDMFDTSSDTPKNAKGQTETQDTDEEVSPETSFSKVDSSKKSKALQKIEENRENESISKISLSHNSEEEKNLLNQDEQDKIVSVSVKDHDYSKVSDTSNDMSKKINTAEISSDAETLAKEALLQSDSSESNYISANENATADNTKMKKAKRNGSDSDASTLILSLNRKEADAARDTAAEAKTSKENDGQSDQDINLSNEDAKKKQALLESSSDSDDSTISSLESESEQEESRISDENAKQALLASSSEEDSDSESETNTNCVAQNPKRFKRNHEPESDRDSLTSLKKRKKFQLNKNPHYQNDQKLRISCKVHLVRLSEKVLKRYSHALEKSREYLDNKSFKRYQDYSLKSLFVVLHRSK